MDLPFDFQHPASQSTVAIVHGALKLLVQQALAILLEVADVLVFVKSHMMAVIALRTKRASLPLLAQLHMTID